MSHLDHNGRCSSCGGELSQPSSEELCYDCLAKVGFDTVVDDSSGDCGSEGELRRFGDFDSLTQIGSGGMGVVYRAYERSLDRQVALKLMSDSSPKSIQQFRIGAEAAAKLDHPHIVPIFSYGKHGNRLFLNMKLVEGESLKRHIAGGAYVLEPSSGGSGKAPNLGRQRKIAQLIATVARAVHHAHEHGVVHRDLKPANILIDAEDRPQLVDFGLAKLLDGRDASAASGVMGTVPYMSPEQATGLHAREPSDIYSLGAILYELLTGRIPFSGRTPIEMMKNVETEEPKPPRSRNPQIDRDLETICLKCLEKDPGHRYATAELLAQDLECWLSGRPIQVRPVGRLMRIWKWVKRNQIGSLLILSFLTGFVVAVGLLFYAQQLRKSEQAIKDSWFNEHLEEIREQWVDAALDSVEIPYSTLAMMDNRRVISRGANGREFLIGLFADTQDRPEVVGLAHAQLAGLLERRLGDMLQQPVLVGLRLFKQRHSEADDPTHGTDFLLIDLGDYLRFRDRFLAMKPMLIDSPDPAVILTHVRFGTTNIGELTVEGLTFAATEESLHLWTRVQLLLRGFDQAKISNAPVITFESFHHLIHYLGERDYNLAVLPMKEFRKHGHVARQVLEIEHPPLLLLASTNLTGEAVEAWQGALTDSNLMGQVASPSNHTLKRMRPVAPGYIAELIQAYQRIPTASAAR